MVLGTKREKGGPLVLKQRRVGIEKPPLVLELEYFKSKVKILELILTKIIYKNGELFLPFATVYFVT